MSTNMNTNTKTNTKTTKKHSNRIKHFVTVYEREFIISAYNDMNHKYRALKAKRDDMYNHYLFDEGDELEDTLEAYLNRMKMLKRRFRFSFSIPKSLMVDGVI